MLVVSQFTLFASTRKGTRPSFNDAAKPDLAIPLYEAFNHFASTALGNAVATIVVARWEGRFDAATAQAILGGATPGAPSPGPASASP